MTNVSANLLVLVGKLVWIPKLGLQRHLASKGLPRFPRGPKAVARTSQRRPSGSASPSLDGKVLIVMICLCKCYNWKLQNATTRVGFGRTEVSVQLNCIVACALSFLSMVPGILVSGVLQKVGCHVCLLHGLLWDFGNNHEN